MSPLNAHCAAGTLGLVASPAATHPNSAATSLHRTKEPIVINPGDTLINSATGEELAFLQAAASTGGEYVEVVCTVEPRGAVAAAHIHPRHARSSPSSRACSRCASAATA